MNVVKDVVVSLRYRLSDADTGEVLEQIDEPVSYLHGGYDGIFPVVEEALHGKAVGDSFSVIMQPSEAFGEYEHDLVRVEPRGLFPGDVQVGMQFEGRAADDDEEDYELYTVIEVNDKEVTVDGNHPLAGRRLCFEGSITGVRPATQEELMHGHVHGPGGHLHH